MGKYSFGDLFLVGFAWIFARHIFVPFNKLLFHLAIRGLGVFNYQTFRISGERYLVRKLLPRLVPNADPLVMFDVGANEGNYSSCLLAIFPKAVITCFEPHGKTYERLLGRLGGRCRVLNIGLGEARGAMRLYDVGTGIDGTSHASLYPEVITEIHHQSHGAVEVEIRTLDDVANEIGITRIDFLKIDTEGNELSVLKGAKRLLDENRIGIIHFEFNEMNVISRSFMRDFRLLLEGYRLFRLLPNSLLELADIPVLTELFGFQNIVAVKSDHPCFQRGGLR